MCKFCAYNINAPPSRGYGLRAVQLITLWVAIKKLTSLKILPLILVCFRPLNPLLSLAIGRFWQPKTVKIDVLDYFIIY